jgi:hypothetical protein
VGLYPGDVGLYPGEVGLYPGEVGLYPGELGLYPGELGLYPGDAPGENAMPPTYGENCASVIGEDLIFGLKR